MKKIAQRKGIIIVLVAFLMVVFLTLLALVVDVGMLFLERIELINILDAVVLSGVQELPDNNFEAKEVAQEYAANNNLSQDQITISIIDTNRIKAEASKQVAMNFAPIIGIRQVTIRNSAQASINEVAGLKGVVPFGIVQADFVYGKKYYLKYGAGGLVNEQRKNGNFGALALGGTGAKNYEENIKYGHDQMLSIGDEVTTEPGNMAGPTRKGVEYIIKQCDHLLSCTYDSVKPNCPRLLYVPVIDSLSNGRSSSEVVGFAAFFLEGINKEEGNSYVEGYFIKWLVDSAQMSSNAQDFGLRNIKLVD